MGLLAALIFAAPAFSQTGRVEGAVVNSVTGEGIAGVTVRLTDKNERYQTVTDGAGTFVFETVKPGDYQTSLEHSAFTAPRPRIFPPPLTHVAADSQTDPVRLRLELLPPSTLRGRVFGIDGKPAAGAKVDLGGGKMVQTAEDGSFTIEKVAPGSYTLIARPAIANAKLMQDGVRMAILPTYYPQEITVKPGMDQGGYDIRLQAAPVYRVRGVVLDPDGKPAPKAVVELLSKHYGGEPSQLMSFPSGRFSISSRAQPELAHEPEEAAVTDKNGVFEFATVQAGDWIFRAESDNTPPLYGSEPVVLGKNDIDDLRIQLRPPFNLVTSIELSDGSSPPSNVPVAIDLISEDGIRASAAPKGARSVTPGRYRIRASILFPTNYYVASILVGNADAAAQAVELFSGSPPLRIVLKPGSSIRGTVENGATAVVVAWPKRFAAGDTGVSAACSPGGAFEISGLAPGDYYAIAVAAFDAREMADTAHLTALSTRATSVRVEEGSSASLQLSVTR
jgi:protocatechuate 3,4-dioxygenase beta subunit